MSREYVSTECNCRRISVIVYRSASDKLAVDSFVLLVCGLSRKERERLLTIYHKFPEIPVGM